MAAWPDIFNQVLQENLPRLADGEQIEGQLPLSYYGLDSMGTVNLLVALEQALDVEFPDEALVPETFETADALWAQIHALSTELA